MPLVLADETIVIVDSAPAEGARDRDRALGDAPFVTVVHPDDQPAAASVADGLATSAGVQARSLGGMGAFQAISVRGNASGQTEVLIDGVPLARLAAVTTDLGRFALDGFGEVDLYRGAVPVELGGAGVGGAVNMRTRLGPGERGEVWHASMGGGSYGARHLRLRYGDRYGDWLSSVAVGYQGATGDFPYFSNHNTPLVPSDDGTETRTNDGFDQVDAAARMGRADGTLTTGARVAWKDQGLPGPAAMPTLTASLGTLDAIADATFAQDVSSERLYLLVEDQHLRDPHGELGIGQQERRYLTLSGGATAAVRGDGKAASFELRGDHFSDGDDTGMSDSVRGSRVGGAAAGAFDVVLASQLVLTIGGRLDILRTSPSPLTVGPMAFEPLPTRWDVVPSPRVSLRAPVADDVSIKGSAGYYVRLPTLVELFGNRGYVIGEPDLLPERGPSADFGLVWAPARGLWKLDRVLVEADAFAARPHDTISFITTAGFVQRAANIGDTQSYGGELVASARLARRLSATLAYTRTATEQISADVSVDGKPVPRTPGHLVYARADAQVAGPIAAWVDARYQATSFLDPAALGEVPARTLVGAGLRVALGGGVSMSLDVANLADVRVVDLPLVPPPSPELTSTPSPLTDVGGFPLPGRTFYLSLHWSHR